MFLLCILAVVPSTRSGQQPQDIDIQFPFSGIQHVQCSFQGSPAPLVMLLRNGTRVVSVNTPSREITVRTTSQSVGSIDVVTQTLFFTKVIPELDSGIYSCFGNNTAGMAFWPDFEITFYRECSWCCMKEC